MSSEADHEFAVVHTLALRGSARALSEPDAVAMASAGLVRAAPEGFELTEAGHRRHRALLDRERAAIDLTLLELAADGFAGLAARGRTVAPRLAEPLAGEPVAGASAEAARHELARLLDEAAHILRRCAAVAPRFGAYRARLAEATVALGSGHRAGGALALLAEIEEDLLQTLGHGPELP